MRSSDVVGLLLAFGLSLAVSRYEDRRANVVSGPTPSGRRTSGPRLCRSRSAAARSISWSATRGTASGSPTTSRAAPRRATAATSEQRDRAAAVAPRGGGPRPGADRPGTAPLRRNAQRDVRSETARVAALTNRVRPRSSCSRSRVRRGARAARRLSGPRRRGVLGGRGRLGTRRVLLLVTADLDRPTRGLIRVPDTVLKSRLAVHDRSRRRPRLRGPHSGCYAASRSTLVPLLGGESSPSRRTVCRPVKDRLAR